jgi:hypothetical protein
MLDKAAKIIARQDLIDVTHPDYAKGRDLLLFFINTARRAMLRSKTVSRFFDYRSVPCQSGIIDAAGAGVKLARTVEYVDTANKIHRLSRLKDYDTARITYPDFTVNGTPASYLEMGTQIWLLPVPVGGTVKMYGEFWPADLTDLTDSPSSSDILTAELPEAWIYLGSAEYLDYFAEPDKAQYWRQKGATIVAEYLAQDTKRRTFGQGFGSDPFGDGGVA